MIHATPFIIMYPMPAKIMGAKNPIIMPAKSRLFSFQIIYDLLKIF